MELKIIRRNCQIQIRAQILQHCFICYIPLLCNSIFIVDNCVLSAEVFRLLYLSKHLRTP